jgi:hypothetical protein
MTEVPEILEHLRHALGQATGDMRGLTIVVSAGGTREPLDPVRVLTNRSSGKMGFAIAAAARDRGARTALVTAPTNLQGPAGVSVVRVNTALEMRSAVLDACRGADVLIMAAAVADYRPAAVAASKVKKGAATWTIDLIQNPTFSRRSTGRSSRSASPRRPSASSSRPETNSNRSGWISSSVMTSERPIADSTSTRIASPCSTAPATLRSFRFCQNTKWPSMSWTGFCVYTDPGRKDHSRNSTD